MKKIKHYWLYVCVFLLSPLAQASNTGMPWESPLEKIVNSVTGPVAFGISVLGVVAAGISLIFNNNDMSGFVKMLAGLALIISLIVFAVNLLSSVFGVSSTLII
ncbi:TrbC/VirB2 family protein [Photobacterium leiognathi]|uniref:TrbC/VirB2 family protein n=1 Tax=Photobacterium leiognathi TaxID=553611 RepID=UPI002738A97F|nr:TrbC/VirB2 family protein [Photobacterium leiognathi]